jgi:hypothetical protein
MKYLVLFVSVAASYAALPDGPGKSATLRVCGKCHSPEQAASLRVNRTGWEEEIGKMVKMGAAGSQEEFEAIADYLSKNYGPEAPPPVNINKATAVELESRLLLTKTESAGLLQYRAEHGDFKSLDDLRNVPKLDFKKIEAKKFRIVF